MVSGRDVAEYCWPSHCHWYWRDNVEPVCVRSGSLVQEAVLRYGGENSSIPSVFYPPLMTMSAQPLNVGPGLNNKQIDDVEKPPNPTSTSSNNLRDISSPHELTAFVGVRTYIFHPSSHRCQVENLLGELETKFDNLSSQMLDKSLSICFLPFYMFPFQTPVNQMSDRVDALEAAIQDVINGESLPPSPSPQTGNILGSY